MTEIKQMATAPREERETIRPPNGDVAHLHG